MKDRIVWLMIMVICLAAAAQAGVDYAEPAGGWFYIMQGDSDVTADNWYEDNSEWDGTAPGTGYPGGVAYLVEEGVTYIRIQDTGDPEDYSMPDPSNRKICFWHNLSSDGLSDPMGDTLLDDGVTFSFRARLSTTGILDDRHPNGGGGTVPWPTDTGDGHEIHNSGNGMFGIHQKFPIAGDDDGAVIAFSLTSIPDPDRTHDFTGLTMSGLSGTTPSGTVDTGDSGATRNYTTAFDNTDWHEFWITIEADTTGGGTHKVIVYMDGELVSGEEFDVTAGHGDNSGDKPAFLQMGSTNTGDSMAFDLDFMAYKPGVHAPVPFDETYNLAPSANAGPDQAGHTIDTFQLAGTASDNGPLDGVSMPGTPGGIVSASWYQQSGSGVATITPADTPADDITDILNSTVTFTEKGVYELVLQVEDIEPKDANVIVVITVKDHADEFLIGHWEMEDNLLDSTASANHGEPMAIKSPKIAYVDGIDGGRALLLVNPDRTDPNGYVHLGAAPELDIQSNPPEFTVTAWFKTTNGSDQIIIGKGGDDDTDGGICWLLQVDSSGVRFVTDDNDNREQPRGPQDDNDGIWHFAAGVSDSWGLRVYVDGVLTADDERGGAYDISGSSQRPGFIGAGTEWDDTEPNDVNSNIFDGVIDDVRVYNYALPFDDPTYESILSLAMMGPLVATVSAGDDFTFNWKPSAVGPVDPLAGVVADLGALDAKTIEWTSSDPGAGGAIFADKGDPATTVEFPGAGVYTLQLEVFDPDGVDLPGLGYISDTVVVTVSEPTCADVDADGLLLAYDFDGDCYIGLSDLKVILDNYLECNDPLDPACPWAF